MNMTLLLALAGGLSFLMTGAWGVQRLTKSSGWVDTIWSAAVGIVGIAAAILPDPTHLTVRQIVVASLITVWAVRLASHIAKRTHGAKDDPRYAALADQWGKAFPLYLFLFLQIQAAAAFVLVLAVHFAAINTAPFPSLADILGLGLLAIAFVGEGVADAQLAAFSKAHKGQNAICDTGLWAWSRHPNYFFEWLGWCGWAVLAMSLDNPWSFVSLGAPLLMYWLLVHVSGIPPLEDHMLGTRGDAFKAYQTRTSAFFPLPPRKPKSRKSSRAQAAHAKSQKEKTS